MCTFKDGFTFMHVCRWRGDQHACVSVYLPLQLQVEGGQLERILMDLIIIDALSVPHMVLQSLQLDLLPL